MIIKWIIALLVIAGLGWLLWSSGWLKGATQQPAAVQNSTATTTQNTPPAPINGMSANNDTSDAALAQDVIAIDAQMKGLATDSASMDASMNDKATTQAF